MQQVLPHVLNVNMKPPGRYCHLQLTMCICHAMFMYVLVMCALTHKTCADETFGNIRVKGTLRHAHHWPLGPHTGEQTLLGMKSGIGLDAVYSI